MLTIGVFGLRSACGTTHSYGERDGAAASAPLSCLSWSSEQALLHDVSEEYGLARRRPWPHGHGLRWVEAKGAPPIRAVRQACGRQDDARRALGGDRV
jgi:hypothetical protein